MVICSGTSLRSSSLCRSSLLEAGAVWVLVLFTAVSPGCVVQDTSGDILRLVLECSTDDDCAKGWSCRAFAMDPDETTFCVHDCATDEDCSFGDLCGSEGFCVEPCDVQSPSCRGPGFRCLRSNMTVGQTAGYCQPAETCATSPDCGKDFDRCITDSLGGVAPDLTFAEGDNACVESCVGQTQCSTGFVCLKKSLQQLTHINTDPVPEICVPKCGEDNRCPIGYRCLMDSLTDFNPDDPPQNPDLRFCVPGLPGIGLPCADDLGCMAGLCVEDPESDDIWGVPHSFCVEPCTDQGACGSGRFECLAATYGGDPGDYCFSREPLLPCENPSDCELPELCLDWSNLGIGQACTTECTGWRDPSCGGGFTCLPTATPGQFGCYVGLPGMPCDSDSQCHQAYGEETSCIGTTGQPTDPDRTCTKTCTHFSQCSFGPLLGNTGAPLCHQGICQPIAFDCDDPQMPYLCNPTMTCADVYGTGRVCTIACDGLRTTTHACPDLFTCAPLPQSGEPDVSYFCYPGYPGLMPCRKDSECLDLQGDGSQRCISPSGSSVPTDGICSMPCRTDMDCLGLYPNQIADLMCIPGDPDPGGGVPGYCIMNQPLDVFLGEAPGRQGTFCFTGEETCEESLQCVDAKGNRFGILANYGKRFCAKSCSTSANCPTEPVPHQCDHSGGSDGVCIPLRGAEHARGYWEECFDHRQCEDGICYQPDAQSQDPGHCTRSCNVVGDNCVGYGSPDTGLNSSTCKDGVCQPNELIEPGG